jgi:hypothetical protein
MTNESPLDLENYENNIESIFSPIILQNKRIDMTIRYDCNHSTFSRAYGEINILINSTGGNVVHDNYFILLNRLMKIYIYIVLNNVCN